MVHTRGWVPHNRMAKQVDRSPEGCQNGLFLGYARTRECFGDFVYGPCHAVWHRKILGAGGPNAPEIGVAVAGYTRPIP